MIKILWILFVTASLSSGFEISRDSMESAWTGGDSLWLKNKTPLPITLQSIYVKRVAGNIGDGLIFNVSNEKNHDKMGFTHWYELRNSGDSLSIPLQSWSQNPAIRIPPFDSISIKNMLYGTCIFCVSNSQPYDYHVEIHFVAGLNQDVKINLHGRFITDGVHKRKGRSAKTGSKPNFSLNGKIVEAQQDGRRAKRSSPMVYSR
jgi:hypothetical protein